MKFTIYLEWQCPKCYAINHSDAKDTSRRDDMFAGRVPEAVTCAECAEVFE